MAARPEPAVQCETTSPSGRCPDPAYYKVMREDRPPALFCNRCVTAALFYGTNNGKTVTINRRLL